MYYGLREIKNSNERFISIMSNDENIGIIITSTNLTNFHVIVT